jgi:hypothetical protein
MGLQSNVSISGYDLVFGLNHNGLVDDVRTYDRALPADEVKHLHEMG